MAVAVKTFSQFVTHIVIGFSVAWALTGSWALGGLAMLVEPAVNVALLPWHERAWQFIRRRRPMWRGAALTALQKISQTFLHMAVAFGVMFAVTGSWALGGLAAIVEPVCNVLILPLHDRLITRMTRKFAARPAAAA